MRLRVAVFGALGVLATLLGVGLILFPSLVEMGPFPIIEQWGAQRTVSQLLFLIGLGVLLYLLFAARSGTSEERNTTPEQQFAQAQETPPELVTAEKRQLAAASLDDSFTRAIEAGGAQFKHARNLLYQTAVVAYAETKGMSTDTASDHIDRGEWTTDTTAAAVLATNKGPQPPLFARLHLWLRPERERKRRLNRTIEAIAEIQHQ